MPKRVIDYEALWASDKLATCADWAQAEYAWLYGLADASGSFELSNVRVVWGRVAAIRKNLSLERLEQIFDEFHDKGLLFVWEQAGKRYAHWTGSDRPGRLPAPSWRGRLERLAPPVPQRALAHYLENYPHHARAAIRANPDARDGVGEVGAPIARTPSNGSLTPQATGSGALKGAATFLASLHAGVEAAQPPFHPSPEPPQSSLEPCLEPPQGELKPPLESPQAQNLNWNENRNGEGNGNWIGSGSGNGGVNCRSPEKVQENPSPNFFRTSNAAEGAADSAQAALPETSQPRSAASPAHAAARDALLAAYIRAHPAMAEAAVGTGPPGAVRVRRDYLEKIRQRDAARSAPRESSASRGRGG